MATVSCYRKCDYCFSERSHRGLLSPEHSADNVSHLPVLWNTPINATVLSHIEFTFFMPFLNALRKTNMCKPVEKLDPVLHLLLHHPKHLHRTTTTINWPQSQAQNRRGKHIHTNKEHENSRKRRLVAASNNLRMNDWYPRSCKLEAREATSQVSFHRLISFKFWNWMHGVEYQYSV